MYETTGEEKDHYLLVIARGSYDVSAMKEKMKSLVDWSNRTKKTRVLIDTMQVSPPTSEMDKYRLGESFAELVKPPLKVAILSYPEMITKFLEDTAVNRGSLVFVTSDREEALDWLLSDLPETER